MATDDLSVTGADLEALATKLDQIGEQLTERERAVLEGVLSIAAEAISERTGGSEVEMFASSFPVATYQPSLTLGDSFRSAFQPWTSGATSRFGTAGTRSVIVIGGSPAG
jgi:hypothetical protein